MTPVKAAAMTGMDAEMEPSSSSSTWVSQAPPAGQHARGEGQGGVMTMGT
jgi:hypothetical protein